MFCRLMKQTRRNAQTRVGLEINQRPGDSPLAELGSLALTLRDAERNLIVAFPAYDDLDEAAEQAIEWLAEER